MFGIVGTLFELLSLWFLVGFLEDFHDANWVTSLYAVSVLGTAAAALVLYLVAKTLAPSLLTNVSPLYGCFGGIFGLLVAIGLLYGDTAVHSFLRSSASRRATWRSSMRSSPSPCSLARSGCTLLRNWAERSPVSLFVRMAPRRGFSFMLSESWYGLRNRYYRWKRRRAARKFEVYMRSQGRTVKFDGQGRPIDEDADDKKRWN